MSHNRQQRSREDKKKYHTLGEIYSWTVINETTIIKKSDKTFFEANGSAVPKEIKWFFDADDIPIGGRKKLFFSHLNREYVGCLNIDSLLRCRIFWGAHLGYQFTSHCNLSSTPSLIRFHKINQNHYEIDILDEKLIECEKVIPYESEINIGQEGKKKEYYVTKYERNPILRQKAIQIHGLKCMVCNFDFEATYGEAGRNFIEVHHIKPLSTLMEETRVNPETDLICVCSNCHSIIHRKKNGVYSLPEMLEMLHNQKKT